MAITQAALMAIIRPARQHLQQDKSYAKQKSKPEQLDLLSRELRKDAGSAFRNWFRNDHDLSYVAILENVATKAADAAGWSRPKVSAEANIERAENYIVRAFAFAATKKKPASKEEALQAQEIAEAELDREVGSSGASKALLIASYMTLSTPTGLALWIASPAMRRVTPAVLVLIHIRYRLEAEARLGGAP